MHLVDRDESMELERNAAGARLGDLRTWSGEVAHELKNPLAGIRGLAQLMQVDPSRASELLARLLVEVDRMRALLDEFLDFSRPLVPSAQETVDLGALCRDVVAVHEGVAAARGVTLTAPREALELRCDPRKAKQILVNLVQNAVEASAGGSEVRVTLERRNGLASVRVLDRGCGLSPAIAARAFEPGVTSKAGGSGLGLSIARSLAEQHGGTLRLSNREGGGCVAELLLPIR